MKKVHHGFRLRSTKAKQLTNARHFCTYLNAFYMVNPDFVIFYNSSELLDRLSVWLSFKSVVSECIWGADFNIKIIIIKIRETFEDLFMHVCGHSNRIKTFSII